MILIFTAQPETMLDRGQGEPADRPVIAPAATPDRQGMVLRQYLTAYAGRE